MRLGITFRLFIALGIVVVGLLFSQFSGNFDHLGYSLAKKPLQLPVPMGTPDHLTWFIHITDIHLSHLLPGDRLERFQQFVEKTIPAIQPKFVVVTGDLSHGKYSDEHGNRQFVEEWKLYKQTLQDNNRFDYNFWIDLR